MVSAKSSKTLIRRFWRFLRNIILFFFISSVVWVVVLRFVPVFFTPLMVIRSIESIFDGETPRNAKHWVPIDNISQNMIQAVVSSEDNLFLTHNGFSFEAIEKAIKHNKSSKRIRGGSTISQQTAKNVFLWPQRSYFRKGLEAYFTVLIELFWSKERIMEVYLNVIETGKGVYGVDAAAELYFNKPAASLNKSQAALIAACLPNPRKFNAGNPSTYIVRRKTKIMTLMGKIENVDFDKKKKKTKK